MAYMMFRFFIPYSQGENLNNNTYVIANIDTSSFEHNLHVLYLFFYIGIVYMFSEHSDITDGPHIRLAHFISIHYWTW